MGAWLLIFAENAKRNALYRKIGPKMTDFKEYHYREISRSACYPVIVPANQFRRNVLQGAPKK